MTRDNARTFRVVLGFLLAAWFVNAPGTPGFLRNFDDALAMPLRLDGFPRLLTDPRIAFALYLAPATLLVALLRPDKLARFAAPAMAVLAFAACVHVETASDATFVTSLWVSLWLTWFTANAHRSDEAFGVIARGLAHAVVALVFLGGLVGKLTPEYWSGEAFYGLYFQRDSGWPYPWLRANFSATEVRDIAVWFSRAAIVAEASLVAAPFLPTRPLLAMFTTTMLGMMIARNYNLFSVLGSLFGLLVAMHLADLRVTRAVSRERRL